MIVGQASIFRIQNRDLFFRGWGWESSLGQRLARVSMLQSRPCLDPFLGIVVSYTLLVYTYVFWYIRFARRCLGYMLRLVDILLLLGQEEEIRRGWVAWSVASGHGGGGELLATVQRVVLWGGKGCVARGSHGEDLLREHSADGGQHGSLFVLLCVFR